MRADTFLRQLKKLDMMIENKQIEKMQWRTIAMSTTAYSSGERVQSSGSQQKMADAVGRYLDIENEINASIDRLIDAKRDVISIIERLNAAEYDLMHKVYVQYIPLEDAAVKCGRSYSWAKSTHRSALRNVQRMLDEREKEWKEQKQIASHIAR